MASVVGTERKIESLNSKRKNVHGLTKASWTEDIDGAAGEMAAAKAINNYWAGTVNSFKSADIGSSVQVRTTSYENVNLL